MSFASGLLDHALIAIAVSIIISMLMAGLLDGVLIAAITSFSMSMLIVYTQAWHGQHSVDKDVTGIQKFHVVPVPRIGGLAMAAGVAAVLIIDTVGAPRSSQTAHTYSVSMLLLASMPAFLAGLIEDLTKKVSVKMRLLATFASALLACWLLGAYLPRLDVWGLDVLLQWMPFAIAVTAVAVAGVANSINIIDGFHGVAASAVAIMMAGLGFLAWQTGDVFVTKLALVGLGATLGFFIVNYPTGRLFMGDGGAYFLGFWLAEIAVLLVLRNAEVNAWQVFALCSYPVIEVLYSMYRRKMIRKVSPGAPDRLHLHTLFYRRIVCQILPRNKAQPWIRNASVACIVGSWIAIVTVLAIWLGDTVAGAVTLVLLEVAAYVIVYRRLIHGRWLLGRTLSAQLAAKHVRHHRGELS